MLNNPRIPPPLYMMMAAAFIIGLHRWLPLFTVDFAGRLWLGMTVMAGGAGLDLAALWQFFKRRTTYNPLTPERAKTLVTDGLYRYSRNPMYLGLLFILIGLNLSLGHLSGWLIVPLFIVWINRVQIRPEEIALEKKFGAEYVHYTQQVRRWL